MYNIDVKKRIRKAFNRSGVQTCNICKERHILVEHHIQGREIPNANHSSNLTSLCENCHRLTHEGEIVIEKWVMTTDGLQLLWHKKGEQSFSGDNANPYLIP